MPPEKIKLTVGIIAAYALVPAFLFLFAKPFVTFITYLSYLFLINLLVLSLSPLGKIKLARSENDTPKFTFYSWLKILAAAQIILVMIFYSYVHTALSYVPTVQNSLLIKTFGRWGLHPWPMIASLGVIIAYVYYRENKLPLLSSCMPAHPDRSYDLYIKRFTQLLLGVPTVFAISSSIALGALQLSSLFSQIGHFPHSYELNFLNILLGLILFIALTSKYYQKTIDFFCKLQISVGGFLFGFMLFLGIIFTIANLIAVYIHIHELKNLVISKSAWNFIVWSWWLGWAMLFASFIARISYGRTIREVLVGSLLVPSILLFLFVVTHVSFKQLARPNIVLDLLAMTGPLAVIFLLSKMEDASFLMFGFISKGTNKLIKPHKTIKFISTFLQIIAMFCFIYLWFGLKLVSLLWVMGALPSFLFFIWVGVGFYWATGIRVQNREAKGY